MARFLVTGIMLGLLIKTLRVIKCCGISVLRSLPVVSYGVAHWEKKNYKELRVELLL